MFDYHEVKSGILTAAKEKILVAEKSGYFFVMYLENTSENSGSVICICFATWPVVNG